VVAEDAEDQEDVVDSEADVAEVVEEDSSYDQKSGLWKKLGSRAWHDWLLQMRESWIPEFSQNYRAGLVDSLAFVDIKTK